jgi:hypothetical protein
LALAGAAAVVGAWAGPVEPALHAIASSERLSVIAGTSRLPERIMVVAYLSRVSSPTH